MLHFVEYGTYITHNPFFILQVSKVFPHPAIKDHQRFIPPAGNHLSRNWALWTIDTTNAAYGLFESIYHWPRNAVRRLVERGQLC